MFSSAVCEPNLLQHKYLGVNPVNFIDPFGLTPSDAGSTLPQIQIATADPSCDIKAWNNAIINNYNPTGQNGEVWNGNTIQVPDILPLYPENRNDTPPNNSAGFAFQDITDDEIDNPTHLIFWERGEEEDTYTAHQSTGSEATTERTWSINGSFASASIFVTLEIME